MKSVKELDKSTLKRIRNEIERLEKSYMIQNSGIDNDMVKASHMGRTIAFRDVLHLIDSKLEVTPPRRERRRPNSY